VCANINLFMEINEDDFEKYLHTFVTDIWHMLMQVGAAVGLTQSCCFCAGQNHLRLVVMIPAARLSLCCPHLNAVAFICTVSYSPQTAAQP
jgi:hypothetical protein